MASGHLNDCLTTIDTTIISCACFSMTGNGPHAAEFPVMLKQAHAINLAKMQKRGGPKSRKFCRRHLSMAPLTTYLELLGELFFGRAEFVHIGDLPFQARLVLFQGLHLRLPLLHRHLQLLQARLELLGLRLSGLADIGELLLQGTRIKGEVAIVTSWSQRKSI